MGLTALSDIKKHKWETEVLPCQEAHGRGRRELLADTVSRGAARPTAFCVLLAESHWTTGMLHEAWRGQEVVNEFVFICS